MGPDAASDSPTQPSYEEAHSGPGGEKVTHLSEVRGDAARYIFDKIIGKGSSAKVWRAFDEKERRAVAIKEFELWDGSSSQFHREVEILRTLNASDEPGEYTVRLLDSFKNSNGKSCIVMDVSWKGPPDGPQVHLRIPFLTQTFAHNISLVSRLMVDRLCCSTWLESP